MTWQRYNKNLRKSPLLAEYFFREHWGAGTCLTLDNVNKFVNFLFGARSLRQSSVGRPFLLPGQGVNFRRPEHKFCLAWQLPSVSLPTMQRYEYFMAFANYQEKNCCFFTLFRSQFCRENQSLSSDHAAESERQFLFLTSYFLTFWWFLKCKELDYLLYIIYILYIIGKFTLLKLILSIFLSNIPLSCPIKNYQKVRK